MKTKCSICGSQDEIHVEKIRIAFGLSDKEYSFCRECLEDPATIIFQWIAAENRYAWPLVKVEV